MSTQDATRQRSELHKTIWAVANGLRGFIDGWDFKNYVLGFMFYRFVSENLTNYIDKLQHEAGDVEFPGVLYRRGSEKIDIDELNKELATTVVKIAQLRSEINQLVEELV